tara:strand:+ start:139 stop:606 length:468 start_codon:yes stop_codon:yes gene_type:complete
MTTATEVLLNTFPYMAEDAELMPLMRRMGIVENLLKANIAKTDDPSTNREDLERIHAQQDVLLAQVHKINTQLEAIGRERSMRNSITRVERGVQLLGIFGECGRPTAEGGTERGTVTSSPTESGGVLGERGGGGRGCGGGAEGAICLHEKALATA